MEKVIAKNNPRILNGVVVSTKMAKTVVVEVPRLVKHPKYGKRFVRSKRYLAHDEAGEAKLGEKVRIQETRPYSRHKNFKILS
ncbi:MAG: 30S ribosomal protein S17 [Patescibacteria group bacterium]